MANSISSIKTTVNPETAVSDEVSKPNNISNLTSHITTPTVASPKKRVTTILHRLSPASSGTDVKAKNAILNINRGSEETEKLKMTLKSYLEFRYTLAVLKVTGWTVNIAGEYAIDPYNRKIPFASLQERFLSMKEDFHIFLAERDLHFDEKLETLANEKGALSFDQAKAIVDEFTQLSKTERIARAESKLTDARLIQLIQEGLVLQDSREGRLKLVIKSLIRFDYFLAYSIVVDRYGIDLKKGTVEDSKGYVELLAVKEYLFKQCKDTFFQFLDEKKLNYNEDSGLLASGNKNLSFEENLKLMHEFDEFKNNFKESEEISIKSTSKKYKPENVVQSQRSNGPEILTRDQQSAIKNCADSSAKARDARATFLLHSLLSFDDHLELLKDKGWVLLNEATGEVKNLNTLQTTSLDRLEAAFKSQKKAFQTFLKKNGLSLNLMISEIMKGDEVLSFEQKMSILRQFAAQVNPDDQRFEILTMDGRPTVNSCFVKPNGSPIQIELKKDPRAEEAKVTLNSIVLFNGYLSDFGRNGWRVNQEAQYVQGPNDEFMGFEELREGVFNPRREKFLQYMEENGFKYNTARGSHCLEHFAIDVETAHRLASAFFMAEKQKLAQMSKMPQKEIKIDYSLYPHIEELKSTLEVMADFDAIQDALREMGWVIDTQENTLMNPQEKSYDLKVVTSKWGIYKFQLQTQIALSGSLDQFCQSQKDSLLIELVQGANRDMKMHYDPEFKLFTDGDDCKTVRQMIIILTLQDMGVK